MTTKNLPAQKPETKPQSAAERMKARREDAVLKITGELWAGGDGDKIADAALSGGIDPAAVSAMEAAVATARATLDTLDKYDMTALTSARDAAKVALDKADAELQRAEKSRDAAADAVAAAGADIANAHQAFKLAADAAETGEIPASKIPDAVSRIIAHREVATKADVLAGEVGLQKLSVDRMKSEVAMLERDIKELETDAGKGAVIPRPGGLVSELSATQARLKTKKGELKDAEASLKKMRDELSAAEKQASELKTALPF